MPTFFAWLLFVNGIFGTCPAFFWQMECTFTPLIENMTMPYSSGTCLVGLLSCFILFLSCLIGLLHYFTTLLCNSYTWGTIKPLRAIFFLLFQSLSNSFISLGNHIVIWRKNAIGNPSDMPYADLVIQDIFWSHVAKLLQVLYKGKANPSSIQQN